MKFGYADESGEPGVTKNSHDYFVFCVVIFKNRAAALDVSDQIEDFRKAYSLPDNFELHYAKNPKKIRLAFVDYISKLNFNFFYVSIKKDGSRATASFSKMTSLLLESLQTTAPKLKLEMDKNPRLYKEIRSRKKSYSILLHVAEKDSRGHNLIQLADYVTSLQSRFLRFPHSSSAEELYKKISNKIIIPTK